MNCLQFYIYIYNPQIEVTTLKSCTAH